MWRKQRAVQCGFSRTVAESASLQSHAAVTCHCRHCFAHLLIVKLRSPKGCPWDREQDHLSLRWHAVEEVYELLDAIEARDDHEMEEELGDLLLQVVFHCQLAKERGVFNFEKVARRITEKLIRRHPHVFGTTKVKDVDEVWANWEKIKRAEKHGTKHARASALDGIPKHLPSLLRAEKLVKKARKAKVLTEADRAKGKLARKDLGSMLFSLDQFDLEQVWSAEDLLKGEVQKREREFRRREKHN